MSRADIAYANFEYLTYSTPNTAARDLIEDEDLKYSEVVFPTLDNYDLETYTYIGDEANDMYNEYWKKVKSE